MEHEPSSSIDHLGVWAAPASVRIYLCVPIPYHKLTKFTHIALSCINSIVLLNFSDILTTKRRGKKINHNGKGKRNSGREEKGEGRKESKYTATYHICTPIIDHHRGNCDRSRYISVGNTTVGNRPFSIQNVIKVDVCNN